MNPPYYDFFEGEKPPALALAGKLFSLITSRKMRQILSIIGNSETPIDSTEIVSTIFKLYPDKKVYKTLEAQQTARDKAFYRAKNSINCALVNAYDIKIVKRERIGKTFFYTINSSIYKMILQFCEELANTRR